MTGIILAGGKSSRIKVEKAFLKIGDKPIIEIILNKLKKVFPDIIIVTNSPSEYKYLGVKLFRDIIPEKGSLGGLYTGLVNSESRFNFVVACDMPFISENLIREVVGNGDEYDVIVPKINNNYEPLFAMYSKSCVSFIKKQLDEDNLKITNFFPFIRLKEVAEYEIKQFDPDFHSFININTGIDYEDAVKTTNKI
ncbi:MAG: molybdenum cofactor guanylyltransferase [Ruminiclostridium sp.]|nr:molybdenum cofactor guanylyltransferase [Ruminiclostridium sp.]